MIKTNIICDLTNKEIPQEEVNQTTICAISYPVLGTVKSFNGSEDILCIKNIERYEFHISAEKSKQFMIGIQRLMKELKEE